MFKRFVIPSSSAESRPWKNCSSSWASITLPFVGIAVL